LIASLHEQSTTGTICPSLGRLETAIARVIQEGKVHTYDMGGKDSALDVAKAIADYASS
jgi:hypothetical protein